MNTAFVQFFAYGRKVQIKVAQKPTDVYMTFCSSNYSFIEFILPSNFEVHKYINIFHIRNTRLEKETQVLVRMRDYNESFKIYASSHEEALKIKSQFDAMGVYISNYPYCEFSIKNLVRYAIYYTRLANVDNTYSLEDISLMLRRMKIFIDDKTLEKLVRKSVLNMETVTNFDFRRVFKVLMLKEELVAIFKKLLKISDDDKIKKRKLPLQLFLEWLQSSQRSTSTIEDLTNFFQQIRSPNIFRVEHSLVDEIDFEEFSTYFFTSANLALNTDRLKKFSISDHSLINCYCATSCNSYLTGNMTFSKPSIEGYQRALENGCRAVEIICWDGPNGRPIISHAKTLASSLEAEDLLKFLSRQAFKHSDMPLILFLEVHCSKQQREVLGSMITKIFSDSLYLLNKDHFYLTEFPTLDKLQRKVLIKYKGSYPSFLAEEWNENLADQKVDGPLELLDSVTTIFEETINSGGLKTIFGIAPTNPHLFENKSSDKVVYGTVVEFTKQFFSYMPHASDAGEEEVGQRNVEAWNAGVQFVPLEIYKNDINVLVNYIKFRENGQAGIIAKPYYLCGKDDPSDIKKERKIIFLKIVSAQIMDKHFLKDNEKVYPFIQVKVIGMKSDVEVNKPVTTKIVQANLFHPTFDEASNNSAKFRFFYPESAFIVIEVLDAKQHSVIKRAVLPVSYVAKGLRSVELYDKNNVFDSFSFMLLDIDC
jgi:hypothetical protein